MYDPVRFYEATSMEKGSENIASFFNGVNYYFIHESNKKKFEKSPNKYISERFKLAASSFKPIVDISVAKKLNWEPKNPYKLSEKWENQKRFYNAL